MAKKKKVSRKELLKKPDEFITLSTRTLNWAKDNYKIVILIGSAVILLAALYFGYSAYRNRQERLSQEKYFTALGNQDQEKKLKQLEEIIKDYSGTQASQSARVTAGNLYYDKKDYDQAIASYQSALKYGKFPPAFRTMIRENLAYAFEEKGDLAQAAKTLSTITQEGTFLKEDSLMNLARVYQKMGKKEEAKAIYRTILNEFPHSVYRQIVQERLAGL
jgi:predicted negative regulator of RcsB-dependent stress response